MEKKAWYRAAVDLRRAHEKAGASPLVPTVKLTVNIRPGKPPEGKLGELLAKHEHTVLAYLEKHPNERARMLTDPLGVLREILPDENDLHGALAAARSAKNATADDAPDAKLDSVHVNVAKTAYVPPPGRKS